MSQLHHALPFVVEPGQEKVIRAFGAEMTFHLTGDHTEGRYMLATIIAPVGEPGRPPHFHENEDECFMVKEGRMSFFIAGEWNEVEPGTNHFRAEAFRPHAQECRATPRPRFLTRPHPPGSKLSSPNAKRNSRSRAAPTWPMIKEISSEHGIHYV